MYDINTTIRLARAFGDEVQETFDPHVFRAICDTNKARADDFSCATHDFCDANMLMASAFEATMGREINGESEADCKLWSDAWAIAKAADFFA